VTVESRQGEQVVIKRTKNTARFHEFLLASAFALLSVFLCRPSRPPDLANVVDNEGAEMREFLARIGIPTPKLVFVSRELLIEEYVAGGDFMRWLICGKGDAAPLSFEVGRLTGLMHKSGLVFNDNKAQNYLVGEGNKIVRTDLAFIKKTNSLFSRSMDVGSFLSSVIGHQQYREIEERFFSGYKQETGLGFPYLSIIIRNILALGISSDIMDAAKNMLNSSGHLLSV
jgi:tRNA A-37 threonylcarbamoyl transferase component Bud32